MGIVYAQNPASLSPADPALGAVQLGGCCPPLADVNLDPLPCRKRALLPFGIYPSTTSFQTLKTCAWNPESTKGPC